MSGRVPTVTSPPWSKPTKTIVTLVMVVLLLGLLMRIDAATWTSLVLTVVFAYLLSPLVNFFEHRLYGLHHYESRRTLAVLMTWLVLFGLMGIVVGLIVPATLSQLRQFAEDVPDLMESTQGDIEEFLSQPITIGDFTIVPWEEIQGLMPFGEETTDGTNGDSTFSDTLQSALFSISDSALTVVGGAVSVVVSTFLALVMMFYIMRDGPTFIDYFVRATPESYRGDILRLFHELGLIWNAYLRGQIMLGVAVGSATYVVTLILGLPQSLLLAILAGFLEFIPNLGPTLSAIPAVLFALTSPSSTVGLDAGLAFALVTAGAYMAIQQLEAIFLVPRILGNSLDLHPLVVLVAILIGSSLAGLLGVILAAPTVATLRLFGRYVRGKLLDEELFPAVAPYSAQQRGMVYQVMHYFLSKRFPVLPPSGTEDWQRITSGSTDRAQES
ncbi:AI-2E family transporter [Aggregatilinea lenta]|uniref:AI-2E family transporter n=1 Tax=Aggregatilinea lenta TaxID=913108 RepID=UPI0013C2DB1F|nr:AI-2E family transporter [Aggregatilinea lenta]